MTNPIPDDALDDRLAFVGTAGSGKTYAASTGVERLLRRRSRCVIVDPLGVWYGLRLNEDGKSPGFNVVIFGGLHGDLALNEHAGALIGETVATMAESCIIDLSGLATKSAERRFMLAFLDAVYRKTDPRKVDPYHIVFDEADLWAPQKSSEPMLQSRMEEIVRRGRVRGFIPWLITQRPAVLSKDVLSQADGMIALKLTSSQDRDAIGGWIEGQADRQQGKAILASLPTMQKGQGVVWLPARGVLATVQFPKKTTFDSSRTPKRGEKRQARELAPLDLVELKTRLAAVEEETKANDPKALKAEIARLKNDIANRRTQDAGKGHHQAEIEQAFEHGHKSGHEEGFVAGASAMREQYRLAWEAAKEAFGAEKKSMPKAPDVPTIEGPVIALQAPLYGRKIVSVRDKNWRKQLKAPIIDQAPAREGNGHLPPGERAVLIAAAQFGGVEREQLTILTGYKRSTRDAYIQRLLLRGYVHVSGSTINVTAAGTEALPDDYEPLPTGHELQSFWLERLPHGEKLILQALIEGYPNSIARTELDEVTGFKRSTRDAYLQRMKAKRLWEGDGHNVRASEELF